MTNSDATDSYHQSRRSVLALLILSIAIWIIGECCFLFVKHKGALALAAQVGAALVALLVAVIPFVRHPPWPLLERVRKPSDSGRRTTTIAIALLATFFFYFTAEYQHRDLTAKEQDESMYLIQARMIAQGRLWMPEHAYPEFFESFNVFARPKYAAIYFPGTALLYAVGFKLHIPYWIVSLVVSGSAVGMTYRVIAELLNGLAGWLAALLLCGDVIFRHLSTMVMSHPLMLLQALLMTWAWLRWRRSGGFGFAALLGIFTGWAAITRPLDALVFAAPITVLFLWDLRVFGWRVRLFSILAAIIAALPLLSLQLILDREITGHWLSTPVTMYHEQYWPQVKIGFGSGGVDTSYRPPATIVPEFRDYYDHYVWKSYVDYRRTNPLKLAVLSRLPLVLDTAVPFPILLVFVPLAIFGLRDRRRWPLLVAVPLFVAAYASFMFFRKQYCVVLFASIYLALLIAVESFCKAMSEKWRGTATVASSLLVVFLVAMRLPQINHSVNDQLTPTPILHDANQTLAALPHKPALVFITYDPDDPDSWSQEPVYNIDVAWPDDAPVIRAHDLGPAENAKLIDYYARLSPDRWVFIYDKSTRRLRSLGPAHTNADHRRTDRGT